MDGLRKAIAIDFDGCLLTPTRHAAPLSGTKTVARAAERGRR